MKENNQTQLSFADLGIRSDLLIYLEKLSLAIPTPIQHQAIPIANKGEDLVGIAQTGTGKTLAFVIPLVQKITTNRNMGLIIVPTRELAYQVDETLRKFAINYQFQTAVLIGGTSIVPQIRQLKNRPRIIIATPGRLIDHLQRGTVNLNSVDTLILDEADRMLDMGFEPDIKRILSALPLDKRQTMLFSATMPERITKIANTYMKKPLRIEVSPAGSAANDIEQEIFIVQQTNKLALLQKILIEYTGTVLIFSRTKFGAKKLAQAIRNFGHTAEEIHSNRSLIQRTKALQGFKKGQYRILVATDIASRGIDVNNIEVVINYDLPEQAEDYVHRIGRTGRAGLKGKAISFVLPNQKHNIWTIERLIKSTLAIKSVPELTEQTSTTKEAGFSRVPQRPEFKRLRKYETRNKSRGRQGGFSRFPSSSRASHRNNRFSKRVK